MRTFLHLLVLVLGGPVTTLAAQALTIDPDYDAERLVTEVFASGECETIFNVRRIGDNPAGIGYFEESEDIVGFSRGIILSTGNVADAVGPNADTDTGTELTGETFDPDLSPASTGTVYDRSGLEFDFIPLQPTVTFRYVFASEEYCEFVDEPFNDIFGFFISGPGLNGPFADGAVNVATVPGTTLPVSINNVNYGTNSDFYLDNEFPSVRQTVGCGGPGTVGPRFSLIEYDGQTVILTATIDLQTCETYHIRLLVGDVQDSDFDSAVFLEAGSFDLGGSVTLGNENGDTTLTTIFEGCETTNVRIQRSDDSNPAADQTIAYRVGANSTAQLGSDFSAGSGSVVIPAGATFANIPIVAFDDGVTEGPEDLWLFLDIPCACYTDSIRLVIDEPSPLVVGLEEAYYCPDETARLRPDVSGGVPPLRYAWSFGSTEAEPALTPPLPTAIDLTVTDACGQSVTKSIATFSSVPPALGVPAQDLQACRGESQAIALDLTGTPPFALTYQLNGGAIETVEFTAAGRQSWAIDRGGVYRLIALEDRACRVAVNEQLRVDFYDPVINPRLRNPTCAGRTDGSITVTHLQTVGPYTYDWTGIDPPGLTAANLSAGNYRLRVTDALGCTNERDLTLRDPDPVQPIDVSCTAVRRPPLVLSASGGVPPYTYSVDGENYFDRDGWDALTEGQYYTLRIRDAQGCETTQPNFFYPKATRRPFRLPSFVPQEIAGSARVEPDYFVSPDQIAGYRWYPADLFDCPNCPNPTVSARSTQTISLVVENIYGCRDSLVTIVAVDGRVPLYVPNIFTPNGDGTNDMVVAYGNPEQVERILSFRVLTRWGNLVHEDADFAPNDARRGWDGLLNGQPAGVATYVWTAEILLTTGDRQQESGTVVLMR